MNSTKTSILAVTFLVLSLPGCDDDDRDTSTETDPVVFTVSSDGSSAEVRGVIVDATLEEFNDLIARHPNLKTLNLVDVPGSDVGGDVNTDSALELGREVYNHNINTHLVDNGVVASGGTDLLASGKSVTVGTNPTIGVHSWGGGIEGNPDGSAWDIRYDEDHIDHQKYLRYYEDIGFSNQKARDFYFFTIRSAQPDDVHDMTAEEINTYLIR
ncbi:MAG: hypothetical protein CSB44_04890 [Gammaproteobacteria bacterium]|nr:MAG: hypothetical protein CSB44_04890 [Gammaproteobacteria bacterium]